MPEMWEGRGFWQRAASRSHSNGRRAIHGAPRFIIILEVLLGECTHRDGIRDIGLQFGTEIPLLVEAERPLPA